MIHINNIKNGPFTSCIGAVIIIAAIVSVFVKNYEWTSVSPAIILGLGLLGIKDPRIGGDAGTAAVIIGLGLIGLSSCKVIHTTKQVKDTTIVRYKDTTIFLKGSSVSASVNDSLMKVLHDLIKKGLKPQIIYTSTGSKDVNLKFSLDSLGHLQATCASKDEMIKLLTKEVQRLHSEKEVKLVPHIPWWMESLLIALVIINVLLLLIILIKK